MLQQCLQALSHATLSTHSTQVFRACVLSLATRAMQISRRFSSPEEDGTLRAVISTLLLDVAGCSRGRRLLQVQLRSRPSWSSCWPRCSASPSRSRWRCFRRYPGQSCCSTWARSRCLPRAWSLS
jgi:hypothetical protein